MSELVRREPTGPLPDILEAALRTQPKVWFREDSYLLPDIRPEQTITVGPEGVSYIYNRGGYYIRNCIAWPRNPDRSYWVEGKKPVTVPTYVLARILKRRPQHGVKEHQNACVAFSCDIEGQFLCMYEKDGSFWLDRYPNTGTDFLPMREHFFRFEDLENLKLRVIHAVLNGDLI